MKEQVDVFPDPSVATDVTVVVPLGNVDPDAGVDTMVAGPHRSVAVTLKLTTAEHWPVVFETVMFAGQVMLGAWVSRTVTVKLHVAFGGFPFEAVQFTVVVPTGKVFGDVIVAAPTLHTMVGEGVPVPVTLNATDAEQRPESLLTDMFAGHVMVGATASAARFRPITSGS